MRACDRKINVFFHCIGDIVKMLVNGKLNDSVYIKRENSVPPVPNHIFEDPSGRRIRVITGILVVTGLLILGFAAEFSYRVYTLKPPLLASPVFNPFSEAATAPPPAENTLSVVMKDSAYTDCGQGVLEFGRPKTGISGFVPFDDPTALAGLRARCRDLEAVYYQALRFGADGRIEMLGDSGAGFPLPDFNTGFSSRNRPFAFPVLTPATGTAPESVTASLAAPQGALWQDMRRLDLAGVDGGLCLDLTDYPALPADALLPAMQIMKGWLAPRGLAACLIAGADAGFWQDQALMTFIDRPVLLGFRRTSSAAAPIAPQAWFENAVQDRPDKAVVALGSFSTLWKSGQRRPEKIPFAEAMLRAGYFQGDIGFSPETGNTTARYIDAERQFNQLWVLDAASVYNQRRALPPETGIALWPLGYEDPTIWPLLDGRTTAIAGDIDLSDHVSVEGAGPFSTHIAPAVPGQRQVAYGTGGAINSLTYARLPAPRRMRLLGAADDLALSVVFDGLGSARQTGELLALLARTNIRATFFLSADDLLLRQDQVAQVIAAGHGIGTDIAPRESRALLWSAVSTLQNNLAQQLLQDRFGHQALLVKNPARYGQFPGDSAVLDQLQNLQSSGYLPVFANLPAPYGTFTPEAFLQKVRAEALAIPANVLRFDFSEQNDRAVNRVLPALLESLVADGFSFTSLPEMAGLTPEQVFPATTQQPVLRDRVIYALLALSWIGVQNFVFLLAMIVALRSPVYLILAFLRRERYPFDPDYQPPVTVIIPAFNEAKVIRKSLESVLASDYPGLEVVVVDDGSKDETAAVVADLAREDGRLTLVRQENHGKWFAEDTAIERLKTPVFVIVDADTLLHKDAIRYLVQPFRDKAVGAVAGTVEIGNLDNIITACQVIEYKISQYVMRRAYEVFNGILVVPGAIGAWRTDAVIKSGLVSGDTITEDADLTVAIHRAGYRVVYAPAARSYTEAPNSVGAFMQQRLRWSLGMLQVAWKHRGAIIEGRAVGFISILDAVWYRIVSSLVYPLVDLIVLGTLFGWAYRIATRGTPGIGDLSTSVILIFLLLTFLDIINLAAAFWFEHKFEGKLLLLVPFLRFGYRQMLYISSIRSLVHAASGRLRGWQKLRRTDTAHIVGG